MLRVRGWAALGRRNAAEAARLLTIARQMELAELLSRQGAMPSALDPGDLSPLSSLLDDGLPDGGVDVVTDVERPGPVVGSACGADLDLPLVGHDREAAASVAALVEVLTTVLESEGFEVDAPDIGDVIRLQGLGADTQAQFTIDREFNIKLDVDETTNASPERCRDTTESILRRLEEHGLTIDAPGQRGRAEILARSVEQSVRAALPRFQVRSVIEGDELQILAWPPLADDAGRRSTG